MTNKNKKRNLTPTPKKLSNAMSKACAETMSKIFKEKEPIKAPRKKEIPIKINDIDYALTQIKKLQEEIVNLNRRVWALEIDKFKGAPVPLQPYSPILPNPAIPNQPFPNPEWPTLVRNTCPKCNISLENVMGYVCGDIDCPTFARTICSNNSDNKTQS